MNTLRRSQSWIALTLVAIIAMAAAPGFALACFCGTAAATTSCHYGTADATSQPHAHCHGSGAVHHSRGAEGHCADAHHAGLNDTDDCCRCQASDTLPFAKTEPQNLLTCFAPVTAALPLPAFSLTVAEQITQPSSDATARARENPVISSLPSRAPPAL